MIREPGPVLTGDVEGCAQEVADIFTGLEPTLPGTMADRQSTMAGGLGFVASASRLPLDEIDRALDPMRGSLDATEKGTHQVHVESLRRIADALIGHAEERAWERRSGLWIMSTGLARHLRANGVSERGIFSLGVVTAAICRQFLEMDGPDAERPPTLH